MRRRVLIVEDEILVAVDVQAALEDFGHEVVGIAADADEALSLVRSRRPDLALVDINLRDGPTGARLGAALAQAHGVAVLFLTSEPSLAPTHVAGVLGAFPKPFAGERLARAIEQSAGLADPLSALAQAACSSTNESGSVAS